MSDTLNNAETSKENRTEDNQTQKQVAVETERSNNKTNQPPTKTELTNQKYESKEPKEPKKWERDHESSTSIKCLTSINGLKLDKRCLSYEYISQVRKKVNQAIADHKIFAIRGGFSSVRRALLNRGWLEKVVMKTSNSRYHNEVSDFEICEELVKLESEPKTSDTYETKCERAIITKLLEYSDIDFFWNLKHDCSELLYRLDRRAIFNRFIKSPFTSKNGLCAVLNHMQWFNIPDVAYTPFPRCYNVTQLDQLQAFVEDFRLNACACLLKWFVRVTEKSDTDSPAEPLILNENLMSPHGFVATNQIIFAINRLNEYITRHRHEDIDVQTELRIWDYEWDEFLDNVDSIVNRRRKFANTSDNPNYLNNLLALAAGTLKEFELCWPQFELDGSKNIWIVKPANKCRGKGIQMSNSLEEVLTLANVKTKKARFVVQKYIERPFLIYETKFDIRQWFLVCSIQPLVIWMYKDSYLRFSTQKFDLINFHESVHLTNNAVQRKYTNDNDRDSNLPSENMWDCDTFKAYLIGCGEPQAWDDVIYPGMRQAIVGAMLASQEGMDRRSNSFELFGADFMITTDFTPWLIEINSSPDMAPTTSVTARLCPQCLEDIIKIVVDQKSDASADPGRFELIYKQTISHSPPYLGLNLSVEGKRIPKKAKRCRKERKELTKSAPNIGSLNRNSKSHNPKDLNDLKDAESFQKSLEKIEGNSNVMMNVALTRGYYLKKDIGGLRERDKDKAPPFMRQKTGMNDFGVVNYLKLQRAPTMPSILRKEPLDCNNNLITLPQGPHRSPIAKTTSKQEMNDKRFLDVLQRLQACHTQNPTDIYEKCFKNKLLDKSKKLLLLDKLSKENNKVEYPKIIARRRRNMSGERSLSQVGIRKDARKELSCPAFPKVFSLYTKA